MGRGSINRFDPGQGAYAISMQASKRSEIGATAMITPRATLTAIAFASACAFAVSALAADTVTALKVDKAPDLKAGAADPAWAKAEALSVQLSGGMHLKN